MCMCTVFCHAWGTARTKREDGRRGWRRDGAGMTAVTADQHRAPHHAFLCWPHATAASPLAPSPSLPSRTPSSPPKNLVSCYVTYALARSPHHQPYPCQVPHTARPPLGPTPWPLAPRAYLPSRTSQQPQSPKPLVLGSGSYLHLALKLNTPMFPSCPRLRTSNTGMSCPMSLTKKADSENTTAAAHTHATPLSHSAL